MKNLNVCAAALSVALAAGMASAGTVLTFDDGSGLSGEAEFTLVDSTTLSIRLSNTSTGTPMGFGASDLLLTGLRFDLGALGNDGSDPTIVGGTAVVGPTSASVNFDQQSVSAGESIDREWGFGNGVQMSGTFGNYISGNTAGLTVFNSSAPNLDGPNNPAGPSGGLIADIHTGMLGGQGGINNEIMVTVFLSSGIADLGFLANGTEIEFGSSAKFIPGVPNPGTLAAMGLGGLAVARRRRR